MTHTRNRKLRARWRELRRPAVCPTCGHGRGKHRVIEGGWRGPCIAREGCDCPAYAGPWPVHHLHVTDLPCGICGVPGSHWTVTNGVKFVRVPRIADMPGEVDD